MTTRTMGSRLLVALCAAGLLLSLAGCKADAEWEHRRFQESMDTIDANLARWDSTWKVKPAAVKAKQAEFKADYAPLKDKSDEASAKKLSRLNHRVRKFMERTFGPARRGTMTTGTRKMGTGMGSRPMGGKMGTGMGTKPMGGKMGTGMGTRPSGGTMGGSKMGGTMGTRPTGSTGGSKMGGTMGTKKMGGTMGGSKMGTGTMGTKKMGGTMGGK